MNIQNIPTAAHSEAQQPDRNMLWIEGGTFSMGSDDHYPEEAPVHRVTVDGFWMDRTPVTNREFREFIRATGYVTIAEKQPDPKDYPGALPHMLKAGSLVFKPPKRPVDLRDWSQWWRFRFGANWRHPNGPGSSIAGLDDHPVVHVAYEDAQAYAQWAGKRFPTQNIAADGYERTSPVTAFPPNGYGLHDMIGNVWEWTSDWYSPKHPDDAPKACCIPENPRGGRESDSYDPCQPQVRIPRKVLKGGSHLCAPNYCRRYRPAARHAQPIDTSTSHIGFRCIMRGNGAM